LAPPTKPDAPAYQPYIKRINLVGLPPIDLPDSVVVFVVGPNNGGKSTFLNEIQARVGRVTATKWIEKLEWDLGSRDDYISFVSKHFRQGAKENQLRDARTGNAVARHDIEEFYHEQRTGHPSFLVRLLNAQNRIQLADRTQAPNVIEQTELHPYHHFFFSEGAEADFSAKIKDAFGYDFRINRTGVEVVGYLGNAPNGARLSTSYEAAVVNDMQPIHSFGDGIRSYTGILLNSVADARPVTIMDEPEAFLHPPQARRLGREMALAATDKKQQLFIATHSSDFIQGALSAKGANTIFLFLDHTNKDRPLFSVDAKVVNAFSKQPFLAHTSALDALFYEQAIVCEGEADIMFFKWALEGTVAGARLEESFWLSAYGKAAIPAIMSDLTKLGVRVSCIFDLDVLLSPEILCKICPLVGVEFAVYDKLLREVAARIKVPPAADALQRIEGVVASLNEADDEPSRVAAIRSIKKSAESLGKSWVLKSAGLAALPKGELYASTVAFIEVMRDAGVLILEEGEIENYVPEVGGHGQAWVRSALDKGQISPSVRSSIKRQFQSLTS
jgi:hypothetical protein